MLGTLLPVAGLLVLAGMLAAILIGRSQAAFCGLLVLAFLMFELVDVAFMLKREGSGGAVLDPGLTIALLAAMAIGLAAWAAYPRALEPRQRRGDTTTP